MKSNKFLMKMRPKMEDNIEKIGHGNGTASLKIVNKCLNTNIYSYLEANGGQTSYLYLNLAHFFNTSVN